MSVYFAKVGRYIKIGFSENPERRVEKLWQSTTRYGRPWDMSLGDERKLLLVIDGNKDTEARCHKALEDYRSNGEWFIDEQGVHDFMTVVHRGHFPRMRRPEGQFEAVPHWEMLPERHEEIGQLVARSRVKKKTAAALEFRGTESSTPEADTSQPPTAAVLSGADGTDGPTPCRPSRLGVAS